MASSGFSTAELTAAVLSKINKESGKMPVIRIDTTNYEWLKSLAVPFEDNPNDVITRIRKELEAQSPPAPPSPDAPPITNGSQPLPITNGSQPLNKVLELDAMNPPDLTHTRVLEARIGRLQVAGKQREWKTVVHAAHEAAYIKFHRSVDQVIKATIARTKPGAHHDSGFRPMPNLGISIQNQDANGSWRTALHLARKAGLPIEVLVEWRFTDGAAHPGETGRLSWSPT